MNNNLDIYINASCIAEDLLYFTTCNTKFLYTLNFDTNEITRIKFIPEKNAGMLFAGLYNYGEKIWMIPWGGENIYIYNIKTNKLEQLSLPNEMSQYTSNPKFRKSILDKNNLYLLPTTYPGVIKIDMINISYEIYADWPKCIHFDKNNKMNFKMMTLYEENLYLFNDDVGKSVKISVSDGKMEIWDIGYNKHFGNIVNNNLYTSPVKNYKDIEKIELDSRKTKVKNIPVSKKNWSQRVDYYSYWYTKRFEDKMFFMPHEANNLMYLDIKNDTINMISIKDNKYKTKRINKNHSIYEIHKYNDNFIIISYQGNLIVVINQNDEIIKKYFLKDTSLNFKKYLTLINDGRSVFNKINWENGKIEVLRKNVGSTIHKLIMESDR